MIVTARTEVGDKQGERREVRGRRVLGGEAVEQIEVEIEREEAKSSNDETCATRASRKRVGKLATRKKREREDCRGRTRGVGCKEKDGSTHWRRGEERGERLG